MNKKYTHKHIDYHHKSYVVIGWREWVSLPELGVRVNAKIDTGARTCALHAFNIRQIKKDNQDWVNFEVHPISRNDTTVVECTAPLVGIRSVTDSGGHREHRPVIMTSINLGGVCFVTEITLTNRAKMSYRMLLGRKALQKYFIIDPGRSYHT